MTDVLVLRDQQRIEPAQAADPSERPSQSATKTDVEPVVKQQAADASSATPKRIRAARAVFMPSLETGSHDGRSLSAAVAERASIESDAA